MRFLFWGRARKDRELDEEIQAHPQLAAQNRIERSETARQAAESARRELGCRSGRPPSSSFRSC